MLQVLDVVEKLAQQWSRQVLHEEQVMLWSRSSRDESIMDTEPGSARSPGSVRAAGSLWVLSS